MSTTNSSTLKARLALLYPLISPTLLRYHPLLLLRQPSADMFRSTLQVSSASLPQVLNEQGQLQIPCLPTHNKILRPLNRWSNQRRMTTLTNQKNLPCIRTNILSNSNNIPRSLLHLHGYPEMTGDILTLVEMVAMRLTTFNAQYRPSSYQTTILSHTRVILSINNRNPKFNPRDSMLPISNINHRGHG